MAAVSALSSARLLRFPRPSRDTQPSQAPGHTVGCGSIRPRPSTARDVPCLLPSSPAPSSQPEHHGVQATWIRLIGGDAPFPLRSTG